MSIADDPTTHPSHADTPRQVPRPAESASEAEFLANQAAAARAEMSHAVRGLLGELSSELSPRKWIRLHPWTAVTVAAGAGAGVGYIFSSRRAHSPQQVAFVSPEPLPGATANKSGRAGFARLIFLPLFASLGQAAKVALNRFLIGLVESALATASVQEDAAQASEVPEPEREASAVG